MAQITVQQAFDLASQHHRAGRLAEAEQLYRQILAREPEHAEALHDLGVVAYRMGRSAVALDLIRRAIAIRPNFPAAHYNLGNALKDSGRSDEAIAAYRQAVALKPNFAEALGNLGNTLKDAGKLDDAIAVYRQAIAVEPRYAVTHLNFGNALRESGRLDEAIAAYRQAIVVASGYADAYSNLGNAMQDTGQVTEAIAAFRQAIALDASHATAHSNLLLALQYQPEGEPAAIAEEHRCWNRQHAQPIRLLRQAQDRQAQGGHIRRAQHPNDRDPNRRLRIGYVSPDFRNHSVCRFALPLIAAHDRAGFEVFCYSQVAVPDAATRKVQEHADEWRSIVALSDTQTADSIRQDQIDILVDLAGHTARNRLLVFARKPAPVQVTYLGYPATTGLETIDYRLTDALADPPGVADSYCSERLIRLPRSAWCYQPQESPPVRALPALESHRITFGSFNNFAKVNQPMLERWAELLHRVEGSHLLLKALGLRSETARRSVLQMMQGLGIDADRLDLRGWVPAAGHLKSYHQVDIALDTYPYHGTTTTCESLWMGVPVVTLAGQSHLSRVGVSLLSNVGLGELVAQTTEQYVSIAAGLAKDLRRLESMRSTLRQHMLASPLMDAPAFAGDVENAYRKMWRVWCENSPPSSG
jgi:predicted O-linked N-acetylglucosamine transferase (SPINDLY family)